MDSLISCVLAVIAIVIAAFSASPRTITGGAGETVIVEIIYTYKDAPQEIESVSVPTNITRTDFIKKFIMHANRKHTLVKVSCCQQGGKLIRALRPKGKFYPADFASKTKKQK